jgi:hypothetical protein
MRWVKIKQHPNYYVSENGGIKAQRFIHLKPHKDKQGRPIISIWKNGKSIPLKIHRLVLEAFVGPCPNGCEGVHINDIPHDNRIKNLAWATHKENMRQMSANGKSSRGEKNGLAKLSRKAVMKARELLNLGFSQTEIATKMGVHQSTLSKIWHGESWVHLRNTYDKRNLRKKLSANDVKAIRKLLAQGFGQRYLGAMFGVSQTPIKMINQGKAHKNIV